MPNVFVRIMFANWPCRNFSHLTATPSSYPSNCRHIQTSRTDTCYNGSLRELNFSRDVITYLLKYNEIHEKGRAKWNFFSVSLSLSFSLSLDFPPERKEFVPLWPLFVLNYSVTVSFNRFLFVNMYICIFFCNIYMYIIWKKSGWQVWAFEWIQFFSLKFLRSLLGSRRKKVEGERERENVQCSKCAYSS